MPKGIRVNQLAKELGVESKAILAKCREEGLGDKVPNLMSVLSIGLSETVREWFTTATEVPSAGLIPKISPSSIDGTAAASDTTEAIKNRILAEINSVKPQGVDPSLFHTIKDRTRFVTGQGPKRKR